MNHTHQGQAGFTLIEVVCAFAVLGIIATTVFMGERGRLHTMSHSFQETAASHLAASRLETVMARPGTAEIGQRTLTLDGEATRRLRDALAKQTVTEITPGLREITVEVSWLPDARTRRSHVVLSTLVALEPPR